MWSAELDEAQAGIQIAGRNISNLRYAGGTTLRAESKEELRSLLMKVKEESEKAGLKLNIQKTKIMVSGPVSSVQFSHSVVSDSLWPHGLQQARLPCSSPTPRACSNSCPSSWLCHPTVSSSVVPFSSCLQSFSASGSFPVSQFFASGGQIIGTSASASDLSMNIQNWFLLRLTGLILLLSKGLSRVFSNSTVQMNQFFGIQLPVWSNSHNRYMTNGKTIALTKQTFVGKVMFLIFNMLSRLVTAFLPRSKHLFISWLQSPSVVILEPKKRKSVTVSIVSPSICCEVAWSSFFECWV